MQIKTGTMESASELDIYCVDLTESGSMYMFKLSVSVPINFVVKKFDTEIHICLKKFSIVSSYKQN